MDLESVYAMREVLIEELQNFVKEYNLYPGHYVYINREPSKSEYEHITMFYPLEKFDYGEFFGERMIIREIHTRTGFLLLYCAKYDCCLYVPATCVDIFNSWLDKKKTKEYFVLTPFDPDYGRIDFITDTMINHFNKICSIKKFLDNKKYCELEFPGEPWDKSGCLYPVDALVPIDDFFYNEEKKVLFDYLVTKASFTNEEIDQLVEVLTKRKK